VRYTLDIVTEVRAFLASASLTREGRLRINVALTELREISDWFRTDPTHRDGPNFVFLRILPDAGRWLQLRLIVDDSPASYGVLRIVYADPQ
jgi:hypothetical protein